MAAQTLPDSADRTGRRSFPVPGTNLYRLLFDPEFRQTFHSRLKQGNRWMVLFYRMGLLPLFGMGKSIMLIQTRGRKSGQLRRTPIGCFRIDGVLHVFSGWGRDASWYRNIQANPGDVSLQVGFRRFAARAESIEDPQEVRRALEGLATQDPRGAKTLMGWDPAIDRIETADFTPMVEKLLVVRFYPL